MKWYKREPDAALIGMRPLTDEQYRAYSVILDLLYSRDGEIPDDPNFICSYLPWNRQRWLRVRAELLALNKIIEESPGKLTNFRVKSEVLSAQKVSEKFASYSQKKQEKQGPSEHSRARTPTPTPREIDSPKQENLSPAQSENSKMNSLPSRRARAKPRTSLPDDFNPVVKLEEASELEHFKDYVRANGKLYADWNAAWRNWLRSPYRNGNGVARGRGRQVETIEERTKRLYDACVERERELGSGLFRKTDHG
jgi:uncharacterized protein YdaU (DUF1376 family)